jgi:hypothetical protein
MNRLHCKQDVRRHNVFMYMQLESQNEHNLNKTMQKREQIVNKMLD